MADIQRLMDVVRRLEAQGINVVDFLEGQTGMPAMPAMPGMNTGGQFVPFEEAERRRQVEFDRLFPNADKTQPYSIYLDDIFGPNEKVETRDEYLRRTGQPSMRDSLRDIRMEMRPQGSPAVPMAGLLQMIGGMK